MASCLGISHAPLGPVSRSLWLGSSNVRRVWSWLRWYGLRLVLSLWRRASVSGLRPSSGSSLGWSYRIGEPRWGAWTQRRGFGGVWRRLCGCRGDGVGGCQERSGVREVRAGGGWSCSQVECSSLVGARDRVRKAIVFLPGPILVRLGSAGSGAIYVPWSPLCRSGSIGHGLQSYGRATRRARSFAYHA